MVLKISLLFVFFLTSRIVLQSNSVVLTPYSKVGGYEATDFGYQLYEGITDTHCVYRCVSDDDCQAVYHIGQGQVCYLYKNMGVVLKEDLFLIDRAFINVRGTGNWRYYVYELALDAFTGSDGVVGNPASSAKLNGSNGWMPADLSSSLWLQVDLQRHVTLFGISTQGKGDIPSFLEYTIQYILMYNTDVNCNNLVYLRNATTIPQVFNGNTDSQTIVTNTFQPIMAKCVRIIPIDWNIRPAIRFDLFGRDVVDEAVL